MAGCFAVGGTDDRELEGKRRAISNDHPFANPHGAASTVSLDGSVLLDGPFFADLGSNGRTCATCHLPSDGWTVTPETAQRLFDDTDGQHPLFRTNDGSVSPDADVATTSERQAAYALLLTKGLIRVGIGVPEGAEFELVGLDDPYGYASSAELSLFRRPLPSTNLAFIPAVMWDGRETGASIDDALAAQSNDATLGHAQALAPLTNGTRRAIVEFEAALFTAQLRGPIAGDYADDGAEGGAERLSEQPRASGRFDLFDAWIGADQVEQPSARQLRRAAIARGQELFNTRANVAGLVCRACHNVANAGASLNAFFVNVGVSDAFRRTPDLPLYTLRRLSTGELRQTTDPGRALITGRWADIDRFKVPVLRGLSARAPYFHNGSAAGLADVVAFYESSLGFTFTEEESADLAAFLAAL